MTSGNSLNYYRDEVNDDTVNESNYDEYRIDNEKATTSKSLKNRKK